MIRRALVVIGLLFSLALSTAHAGQWAYLAYEQFTLTSTARGFTASLISPSGRQQATNASCDLLTADATYTIDGTAVTPTNGNYWTAGTSKVIVGHDALVNFSTVLATSTTGASFRCTYSAP